MRKKLLPILALTILVASTFFYAHYTFNNRGYCICNECRYGRLDRGGGRDVS